MSTLTIPPGVSLRQIADKLGVSVDALKKHAKVEDIERPMQTEQRVEVPDGFLRERRKNYDTVPVESGRQQGMNDWLALDIEYKRVRYAGDKAQAKPAQDDLDALAEAKRAYERLEPDSNLLTIDLLKPLHDHPNIEIRSQAYAWRGLAMAQKALLYGEAAHPGRTEGLSSAKTALMANPKLPAAHRAMALSLCIGREPADLEEARNALERAIELAPKEAAAWGDLAALLYRLQQSHDATAAVEVALTLDPSCIPALEVSAEQAFDRGSVEDGDGAFLRITEKLPTYLNAVARWARRLRLAGEEAAAQQLLAERLGDHEPSDSHQEFLHRIAIAQELWPAWAWW